MTAVRPPFETGVDDSRRDEAAAPLVAGQIPADLADMVSEYLVWRPTRQERAAAVWGLLVCAAEAIRWRSEPEGDPIEEASLHLLLSAAHAHAARMAHDGTP